MTVRELIERLSQYDDDMRVVKENAYNDYDDDGYTMDIAVDNISLVIDGQDEQVVNIW